MASFKLPVLGRRPAPPAPTRQQRRAAERAAAKPEVIAGAGQVGLWRLPTGDNEVVPDNRAGRRLYATVAARAQPESAAAEEAQPTEPRSGLGNRRSFSSPPTRAFVKSTEVSESPTAAQRPKKRAEPDAADGQRRERRHGRWSLRHFLQSITELRAFGRCGAVKHDGIVQLVVGRTAKGNRASITGVQHCGSVWVCPNCAATIANRRAQELKLLGQKALKAGYSAAFVTFTMRHRQGHPLRSCWDALALGWKLATGGKPWIKDQLEGDIFGWVKAVEVTWGPRNGWHVHLHVMLIFKRKVTKKHAQRYADRMWERWAAGLRQHGFTCRRDVGLNVRMASLKRESGNRVAEYLTKLAHEMTGGYGKIAKGENVTPMQIGDLAKTYAEYHPDSSEAKKWRDLWLAWESGSQRRKQMAWSKGLKEWAGVDELEDEQIPELFDADGQPVPDREALILRWDSWDRLRVAPSLACELFDGSEDYGIPWAQWWLTEHQMYWSNPPPDWCIKHATVKCGRCGQSEAVA